MKVPAGWQRLLLQDVAEVRTGLSKSQSRGGLTDPRPYLRVANVQDGYLDLSEVKQIEVPASQVGRFELRSGDILLTEGGDFDKLGRGALWRGEIDGCVHQNHVFAVRVKSTLQLLPEYLSCEVQSARARSYFLSCAKQTTNLASINSTQLKHLPVWIPPIESQRRAVAIVDAWDTAINGAEQLAAVKELELRALRQRVFRDRELPRMRLENITRRVNRKNSGGSGQPLTISGNEGLVSQASYYGKRIAAENADHYTLLRRGEFAYNRSSSTGYPLGAIKRLDACDEGIVSSLYLCFALDDSVNSDYFVQFCEAGGFNRQLYQVAQEGARNHGLLSVTVEDFFGMLMPQTPRDEQERVVRVLGAATRELTLLRDKVRALKTQKRGLMQKLLTGEWRLPLREQEPA